MPRAGQASPLPGETQNDMEHKFSALSFSLPSLAVESLLNLSILICRIAIIIYMGLSDETVYMKRLQQLAKCCKSIRTKSALWWVWWVKPTGTDLGRGLDALRAGPRWYPAGFLFKTGKGTHDCLCLSLNTSLIARLFVEQ